MLTSLWLRAVQRTNLRTRGTRSIREEYKAGAPGAQHKDRPQPGLSAGLLLDFADAWNITPVRDVVVRPRRKNRTQRPMQKLQATTEPAPCGERP
jgi:hypothetical protein